MRFKSPSPSPEVLQQVFGAASLGDNDAYDYMRLWIKATRLIDDLFDEIEDWAEEKTYQLAQTLLVDLPANKFFHAHSSALLPHHLTVLNAWRDSNEWKKSEDGRMQMEEVAGSEFELPADLVLLAMGFVGPEKGGLLEGLGVGYDARGNVEADESYATSVPGVYSCGDARRGQSLVVWAIWEGRECARSVDACLVGESKLPSSPAGPETGGRPI